MAEEMNPEVITLREALKLEQAQNERWESAAKASAKKAAIYQALPAGDLHPGALDQIAMLVDADVQVSRDGADYRVHGPALVPIADYLKGKLATDEFRHFLRVPSAKPLSSAPAVETATLWELQPGESLGSAAIRVNQARRKLIEGSANVVMGLPFGLTPRAK